MNGGVDSQSKQHHEKLKWSLIGWKYEISYKWNLIFEIMISWGMRMIVLGWFWGCSLLRFSVCVRSRFLARRTTQASSAMPTSEWKAEWRIVDHIPPWRSFLASRLWATPPRYQHMELRRMLWRGLGYGYLCARGSFSPSSLTGLVLNRFGFWLSGPSLDSTCFGKVYSLPSSLWYARWSTM